MIMVTRAFLFVLSISEDIMRMFERWHIMTYLDSVQARLVSLRQLQFQTQEDLDALLPSVLDRAFKGEL